jgi:hypothetical protein
MFAYNACRFVLFLFLSLSANAQVYEGTVILGEAGNYAILAQSDDDTVNLGAAGDYAILAKTGISSTVPASFIVGDIAVSPIDGGAMTGFSVTLDSSGEFSESEQVFGKLYAANYAAPTPDMLSNAVSAMEAAYTDAAGRDNLDALRINYGAGFLGGDFGGERFPLTPGVYTFDTDVNIVGDIYFKGSDDGSEGSETDAVFIIQVAGNLLEDANIKFVTVNGAKPENIFWQVAGKVNLMADAQLMGNLLVKTDVTFATGSYLVGRVLSQTACNLQKATVVQPYQPE